MSQPDAASLTAFISRFAGSVLVGLVVLGPGLAACSSGSSPSQGGQSVDTATSGAGEDSGAGAPQDRRDVLEAGGIPGDQVECAAERVDDTTPLDEGTIDRLKTQCDALAQFASSLADNFGGLSDAQRACLTTAVMSMSPKAITNLYAGAMRPESTATTATTEPGDDIASILASCGIAGR